MKKIGLLLICLSLVSCGVRHKQAMPIVGAEKGLELQKADFSMLKNFEKDNLQEAIPAFAQTCKVVMKSPAILNKAEIKIDALAYVQICKRFVAEGISTTAEMRQFLKDNFSPYLVMYGRNPQGKFTSYYEAELRASPVKQGDYKYPIYGRPNDLISINLQDFDRSLPNKRLLGRIEKGKAIPYYTRAEIDKNNIDAPVILWGDDAVDIFLMQIQGSAIAVLPDGTNVRIGYAENNGHNFIGIGSILLKKGLLKPGQASMDKIRDWLKENPEVAQVNMAENPRFVFHGISSATGPVGALGVPLTEGRSMAVDKKYVPLGSLLWLETTGPENRPIEKLVAAQDIGGAIKGVVRGDYFWGHGESALLSAGKMHSSGQYYILLPRNSKVEISGQY